MTHDAPSPHRLRNFVLAFPTLALACAGEDPASADTDASTGAATESPTSVGDDAPSPGDSTDEGGATIDGGSSSETGVGVDATSNGPGSTDDGASSDDGSSSDDGRAGCTSDDECVDANNPFCVDAACVPCSETVDPNAACADKFPGAPACVNSACVQCSASEQSACTGTTPLCDDASNTCLGCTTHADCPDSACHIPAPLATRVSALDGACFDPTTVVHVDFDFNGGQPFTSIQQAVDAFPDGGEGVIVVHEALEHVEIVNVTGGRTIAIMGAPGESPAWLGPESPGPHLSVTGASTVVFLDRMTLASNFGLEGAAVQAETGRLHIQRSAIVNHAGGGIELSSAAYAHVENSFVGGSETDEVAIQVTNADATLLYATVLAGYGASARSLACTNAGVVDVRNSILLGETAEDSVACSGATFLNSGSDQGLGLGNATVSEFDGEQTWWFDDFATGDFHLTSGIRFGGAGQFCLVGVWEDGDPATDIDGDARPNVDGLVDCAGADIP